MCISLWSHKPSCNSYFQQDNTPRHTSSQAGFMNMTLYYSGLHDQSISIQHGMEESQHECTANKSADTAWFLFHHRPCAPISIFMHYSTPFCCINSRSWKEKLFFVILSSMVLNLKTSELILSIVFMICVIVTLVCARHSCILLAAIYTNMHTKP